MFQLGISISRYFHTLAPTHNTQHTMTAPGKNLAQNTPREFYCIFLGCFLFERSNIKDKYQVQAQGDWNTNWALKSSGGKGVVGDEGELVCLTFFQMGFQLKALIDWSLMVWRPSGWCHLYVSIAQIAITTPSPHSNGHPGALFFRRDFTFLPFLPFFLPFFYHFLWISAPNHPGKGLDPPNIKQMPVWTWKILL